MSKQAIVSKIPNCDLCKEATLAYADAKVPAFGSWGYVCESHFKSFHCSLGLGLGQVLVLAKEGN